MNSHRSSLVPVALGIVALLLGGRVAAGASPTTEELHARIGDPEAVEPSKADASGVTDEPRPGVSTRVGEGILLPFTVSPTVAPRGVAVEALGGYDAARQGPLMIGFADATVWGPFAVRAGYATYDISGAASALLALRTGILHQASHGLDLGVMLAYRPQDIHGDGQVMATLALARRFGPLGILVNLSYGRDPEGDDHNGEATTALLYRLHDQWQLGLEARLRSRLGSTDEKWSDSTESVADWLVGPLMHWNVGHFVLTAQGGLAGVSREKEGVNGGEAESVRWGVAALGGVGFVL